MDSSAAPRAVPPAGAISSEQIQRVRTPFAGLAKRRAQCLDENQHLIAAILEHQNANRLADCVRSAPSPIR